MHGFFLTKYLTGMFVFLWLFVGATSTVDAYLIVKYADQLEEENPIGEALIRLGPQVGHVNGVKPHPHPEGTKRPDVSLLVAAKMFGTIVALGTLIFLFQRWPAGAQLIVMGLSVFQGLLMFYIFQ